jgi:glycosyltransferase involved in cell wall biosynthesis
MRSVLAPAVPWEERRNLIVFPHRLAPEKAPWEFDQLATLVGRADLIWVKTRDASHASTVNDGYSSKSAYYRLLAQAKVVVSTARQETFGIAMQEGIASGAWAVAPHRLSYPELIGEGEGYLYRNLEEAAEQIVEAVSLPFSSRWSGKPERAIHRAVEEIIGRFS